MLPFSVIFRLFRSLNLAAVEVDVCCWRFSWRQGMLTSTDPCPVLRSNPRTILLSLFLSPSLHFHPCSSPPLPAAYGSTWGDRGARGGDGSGGKRQFGWRVFAGSLWGFGANRELPIGGSTCDWFSCWKLKKLTSRDVDVKLFRGVAAYSVLATVDVVVYLGLTTCGVAVYFLVDGGRCCRLPAGVESVSAYTRVVFDCLET
ncbi:hypothetical protein Taro_005381 [Colocasia esculenta]|uniref:Uncharacterized protein n=1 Tax=Colocasia esculenta TaxID=4460 RepID=A0A843TXP5_COLES|nr:hypothetical protein [Colocasia esculenta]